MNKFAQIIIILLTAAAAIALPACKKEKQEEPISTQRTVLVYMISSNSLGSSGYDSEDINEMLAGARTMPADCRWIVYHASSSKDVDAELFEITNDGTKQQIATYPQGSSATGSFMKSIINKAKAYAPASSYGLVLWSHASGWNMDGVDDELTRTEPSGDDRLKSFGSDFTVKMNINTLAKVLEGENMDFVYFDACYMGAVEVAYELRNVTRYIVGSPSELIASGMPYNKNMSLLLDGSAASLVQAATNTFDTYDAQFGSSRTCTMGVYDTSGLEELARATAAIYKDAPLHHPGDEVTDYAGQQVHGFTGDLAEYVRALAKDNSDDKLTRFEQALSKVVLYSASTPKLWDYYNIYNCCGMSTYIFERPDYYTYKNYDATAWAKDVVSTRTALDND